MDLNKMNQSEDINNIMESTESHEENRIPVAVRTQVVKQEGGISLKKKDLINTVTKLELQITKMKNMTDRMRERIEYLEGVAEARSQLLQQIHTMSSGYQQEPLVPQSSPSAHSDATSDAEIINYTPQGSPTNTIQYTIHSDGKSDEPIRILLTDSSCLETPEPNEVGANVDIIVQPSTQLEDIDEKPSVREAAYAHKIIPQQENPQEQIQIVNLNQNGIVKVEKNTGNSTDTDTEMSSINGYSDSFKPVTIKNSCTQVRQALTARNVLDSLETSCNDEHTTQIGLNGTAVPTRVLENIQWKSANSATRILLRTIFGRRVLAVSSMTGKASPAFKDKPLKKKLDPLKLKDIITIVTKKCKVDESSVRKVVTTMCSDENKNLRIKQKMSSTKEKTNKENESVESGTSSMS